jgi:hypothetical protein
MEVSGLPVVAGADHGLVGRSTRHGMRLFRCSLFEASLCLRRHTCGRFRWLQLCGCNEYLPSEYLPRWQRTAVGSSGRVATLQWIRWGYRTIGLPTRHVVCLFGQMVALAWTMLVVALPCRDTFRYHYQRDHVVETVSKAKPSGIVELLGSIKILLVKASVEFKTSEGLAARAVCRLRHSYLF